MNQKAQGCAPVQMCTVHSNISRADPAETRRRRARRRIGRHFRRPRPPLICAASRMYFRIACAYAFTSLQNSSSLLGIFLHCTGLTACSTILGSREFVIQLRKVKPTSHEFADCPPNPAYDALPDNYSQHCPLFLAPAHSSPEQAACRLFCTMSRSSYE